MYLSVKQLADNLGVSTNRIRKLIADGRIKGAFKVGNIWVIPVVDGKPQATKGSRGPELTWKRCRPNPVSRLHVNQEKIRKNNETGSREEVISCKTYRKTRTVPLAYSYGGVVRFADLSAVLKTNCMIIRISVQ
jgi:excisionase family DNA binding protein